MPEKVIHIGEVQGISETTVPALRQQFGKNVFQIEKQRGLFRIVFDIVREPMFILLTAACTLYFILGQMEEGFMMIVAMIIVSAISVYQEVRSSRALEALKQYTEPRITVIRDGTEKDILTEDLVPGDIFILAEGNKVPADAIILQENDFTVDESIITGESFPVAKHECEGENLLYQGTTVNSGKCYATVTAIGNNTVLGKLGKSAGSYTLPKTLLQQQVNRFVKWLAFFGISAFIAIWLVNYLTTENIIQSLLIGLTLAMAALPEEIPVAFSSFMALGARHMSSLGIISRQPATIENLGSVSVICLDKTGTITENRMEVKSVYDFEKDALLEESDTLRNNDVLGYAMLASEHEPFDSMEVAIHKAYRSSASASGFDSLQQVYEYPLEGVPPMMTHIYGHDSFQLVAGKGAAERILKVCRLDEGTRDKISSLIKREAGKGYRVIAVAGALHKEGPLPATQDEFNWTFKGFVCLYDPPKAGIEAVFRQFYEAGIEIKLLTGDFAETAMNIAGKAGLAGYMKYHTGSEIMAMKEQELREVVKHITVFARMFPEAKSHVINALKMNGQIVGMTGDGVNDAPALKSADIGIAIGKKWTDLARQAADLVITDDSLEKVVQAIQQGRKIFNNLKKAIRYIISIHIPIILTASLPLLLGWKYPNIFTPVHVIFLELIMGPTCSIFFEREPVEANLMHLPPRDRMTGLFARGELLISIMQGLIITIGVLWLYYSFMTNGASLETTRTMVFTTILFSNIFLTFTNRSFTEGLCKTIRYKNNLGPWILLVSSLFLFLIHFVTPVRDLFGMTPVPFLYILLCAGIAVIAVGWLELYKLNLPFATDHSHSSA